MSRSYKKHPFVSTAVSSGAKKVANRKVRRTFKEDEDSKGQKGQKYKRIYNSWDIRDYIEYGESFESFYQRACQRWKETGYYPGGKGQRYPTPPSREYCKNIYEKWYLRK